MKPILFYDTETTGLPDFKAPSEAPHQPHIVQLAALLVDPDSRQTIASMDVIVRPAGWTIPGEVAAVHGITTERAEAVGVQEKLAVDKTPNLGEAYRHFTGRDLENAHSAMADVQACRDVYFAIQDMRNAA